MPNIRFHWWTFGLAACIVALPREHVAAQKITKDSPKAAASTGPTTQAGVYTTEQAGRGKDVYAGSCKSCHTPSSHTGATFAQWWRGKQLSDLYGFVSTKMPKNDPGSLAPEDAADVVAYLLKMNAMPVGKSELYPDVDSLRQYRIETRRASAPTTAKRKTP